MSDDVQDSLGGHLTLAITGADDASLKRGAAAARAALRAHGVSPAEAEHGRWRRDLCEAMGLASDPTILSWRDAQAALAWDDAVRAAAIAACPPGAVAPGTDVKLSWVQPPRTDGLPPM